MRNLSLIVLLLMTCSLKAQVCTTLGQNGSTAFPVCGSSTFEQTSVPVCGNRQIPTPCTASGSIFQDKNPYWYRFTCFTTGTFAFEIKPVMQSDDYDWQLFDITGHNPEDVYTDRSLFVACNWSGEGGNTGANAAGTSVAICEGFGKPLFSKAPIITEGHKYIMLVSHFTNDSQSGYSLSFGGGTASITDPAASKVNTARPTCNGTKILLALNKKMNCSSLAKDGSDFVLSPSSAKILGAAGINCSNAFDMDTIELTLDKPLIPGNYTLQTQKGSDGNTLLDYCETPMANGLTSAFIMQILQPTPFDSITAVRCSPTELELVFRKPILCTTVATNGSDFKMNAGLGITITGAATTCNGGVTNSIILKLSGPIVNGGVQTVTLATGTDGNTIVDECGQQTAAGSTATFTSVNTVSAAIAYRIAYSCTADTLHCTNAGGNGITSWAWRFNDRATSSQQSATYIYRQFGPQQVRLTVTNGVCSDSTAVSFVLDNELKANFSGPALLCPEDNANFRDTSIGKVTRWNWDFGNGITSASRMPPTQNYLPASTTKLYAVRLIVQNGQNCLDTMVKQMKVLNSCYIAVPTAFTPNGDGKNEYLYPTNAFKAVNLVFRVYNRLGQVLFETRDFTNKWDGSFKGVPQATGTYVWTLQYTHIDTGQPFFLKGTSVLIR